MRKVRKLYDNESLAGWEGHLGRFWNSKGGEIVGASPGGHPGGHPAASTYLSTTTHHRNFRLLFECKVSGDSCIHSGVGIWGSRYTYKDEEHSYQGHLVMVHKADSTGTWNDTDWGLFELYRRGWATGSVSGAWCPNGGQSDGTVAAQRHQDGWHRLEILAVEDRIQVALNGVAIADYRDPDPSLVPREGGPIALQLHWLSFPLMPWVECRKDQEVRFRGLVLIDDPTTNYLVSVDHVGPTERSTSTADNYLTFLRNQ